jgi:hypothetical protein
MILLAIGCSGKAKPNYSVTKKSKTQVEVQVHVKIGAQESIPVIFNLEGQNEGEEIVHDEVYVDPNLGPKTVGDRLRIQYIVGKGVQQVEWNGEGIELKE